MEASQLDVVAEYADIVQIGARNMQNYSLLNACGRVIANKKAEVATSAPSRHDPRPRV